MQLVAYGAQDIYLTGNPQITFWKVVYRRHTNFARESIEQTISGSSTLTSGNRGTVTISRNGDLLSGVHVVSTGALAGLGDAAITDVEVQIGGQKIDKHTAEWMQLWAELTTPDSKADAYKVMTGVTGSQGSSGTGAYATHIPLQFWFCRNPGLALPLIALQYHEVKVVFNWGTAGGATAKVYCDYVYLDTDERRRFAQVSHEYLIEQLQYQTEGTSKASYKLTLNHPVKALYWTDANALTTETMKLKLNGHDRFSAREKEYFRLQQPMCCHTAVPRQNLPKITGRYVDVGSGTDTATAFQAEDFPGVPDTAVSTTKVIVSKGGDGGSDLTDLTAAVTVAEAVTGTTLIYSFLKTDLFVLPAEGDLVEVSVSGTQSARATVHGIVTGIGDGALTGGLTNASNFHVQINTSLCLASLTNEIDTAGEFTINSFKVLKQQVARTSSMTNKINMYSFALEPEEHQPSGTCNFSRIDTATLELSAAQQVEAIYALNYNVLRIMSGMGGLAYSN